MPTRAFSAAFTISDATSNGPGAFSFFILLIQSLIMFLNESVMI